MPGTKRKRSGDAWYLEVYCGSDFTGKPVRYSRTVHCKSAAAADKELAKFYAECDAGMVNKQDKTRLSAFAALWYTEYAERFYKRSALNSTRTAIRIWIDPLLGDRKVSRLSRIDIQQWINHMNDQGLSPKTIRNYYSTLRSIMDYAVDMDVIADTPCRNIRLPKKVRPETSYYNREEMQKLLRCLSELPEEELRFRVAILILLFGGLRKGEVLGLNWDDVDFDQSTIHIHRTRMIGRGSGVYEDTPKTASSIRFVSLPGVILDQIRRLRIQQRERKLLLGPKYTDSPALLQGDTGGPLYPQVLQRWFTRFIEKNDLPKIGLHGLRHTHASMLAYMNTDKMQISERLGHSDLSTTLNIYTHLFEDADKKIADDLSAEFLSAT